MVGRMNGAAALIQGESGASKAQYFHCTAHALNLCVEATTSVQLVRQMWSVLREVNLFHSSPKRQHRFEEVLAQFVPESNKKKLVDLCQTRWVARMMPCQCS